MPFYNLTSEESRGLCEFAERRRARRTTTTMTFEGGSDTHTTVRTQADDVTDVATPFLDAVVSVVEAVLLRYARTCIAKAETSSATAAAGPAEAGVVVERYYPFPSLLLHTPRTLVQLRRLHDAALRDTPGGSAEDSAMQLRATCTAPAMPPRSLLARHPTAAAEGEEEESADTSPLIPAPIPYAAQEHIPAELRRNAAAAVRTNPCLDSARSMVNLSLAAAPRGAAAAPVASLQEMVQVVLQAEAAMVVTCAAATSGERTAETAAQGRCERDTAAAPPAAEAEAPFLVSPDATSCVLVACRVTLHPVWQQRAAAHHHDNDGGTATADTDTRATITFVRRCAATAAAAMVHLDRAAGVPSMLQQLVWESTVPAFLHAVLQHYITLLRHRTATATATATASAPSARTAVAALARLLTSMAAVPSDTTPLLHVDWYVVGGIRMRKCAAPVLEEVMRAFFPPSTAPASSPPPPPPLAEAVPLSALLASEAAADATPATETVTLTVAHRLREEGQCFWSLNTTFQPWCVDADPARRYAYPMTWGLLLSVATGHAWPATVQAGRRAYPMPEVRSMCTQAGYRWLTPLATDRPMQLLRNAVPDHGKLAALLNASAAAVSVQQPLWRTVRGVQEVHTATDERRRNSTVTVTLRSYVATLLARQAAWRRRYAGRRQSAPTRENGAADGVSGDDAADEPVGSGGGGGDAEDGVARVLPLIVRRRVPIPLAASSAPASDDADQVGWGALPPDVVRNLLAAPPAAFLQYSTTPHCEPPDFCALSRAGLVWSQRVRPADVFVPHTDGLYIE